MQCAPPVLQPWLSPTQWGPHLSLHRQPPLVKSVLPRTQAGHRHRLGTIWYSTPVHRNPYPSLEGNAWSLRTHVPTGPPMSHLTGRDAAGKTPSVAPSFRDNAGRVLRASVPAGAVQHTDREAFEGNILLVFV